jgi:hypothetical protein
MYYPPPPPKTFREVVKGATKSSIVDRLATLFNFLARLFLFYVHPQYIGEWPALAKKCIGWSRLCGSGMGQHYSIFHRAPSEFTYTELLAPFTAAGKVWGRGASTRLFGELDAGSIRVPMDFDRKINDSKSH